MCIAYSSGQQLISQERGNKERLLPACLPPCLIINKVGFVTDPIKKTGLSSLSYCIQLIIFSFFDDVNTAQKQSDLKRQKTFFFLSFAQTEKEKGASLSNKNIPSFKSYFTRPPSPNYFSPLHLHSNHSVNLKSLWPLCVCVCLSACVISTQHRQVSVDNKRHTHPPLAAGNGLFSCLFFFQECLISINW